MEDYPRVPYDYESVLFSEDEMENAHNLETAADSKPPTQQADEKPATLVLAPIDQNVLRCSISARSAVVRMSSPGGKTVEEKEALIVDSYESLAQIAEQSSLAPLFDQTKFAETSAKKLEEFAEEYDKVVSQRDKLLAEVQIMKNRDEQESWTAAIDKLHFVKTEQKAHLKLKKAFEELKERKVDAVAHDELKVAHEHLHVYHDKLKVSHEGLKTEHDKLKVSQEDLKTEHDELKVAHEDLKTEHDNLKVAHEDLKTEHDELKVAHEDLKTEHDELKVAHEDLKTEHDELKVAHEDLKTSHEALEERVTKLEEDNTRRWAAFDKFMGNEENSSSAVVDLDV